MEPIMHPIQNKGDSVTWSRKKLQIKKNKRPNDIYKGKQVEKIPHYIGNNILY